jgi:hypothetical protein
VQFFTSIRHRTTVVSQQSEAFCNVGSEGRGLADPAGGDIAMLRSVSTLSLFLLLCAVVPATRLAAEPPAPPRVSPQSTISQVIGVSEITISYSRPSVREGTIWGEAVPFDEVWRTGANEATTVTFSDDVKIEGRELAAGTYGLFTIPGQTKWILAFNRVAEQWGASNYDSTQDALRVEVKPRQALHQQTFQITFPEVGIDTALISLHWGSLEIPFSVQVDLKRVTVARAREFVDNAGPADGRTVWNWANYFYQNGYNTDDALEWATRLAETTPMYWTHALHARLLAQTGDIASALNEASRALARAPEETDQPGVEADARRLSDERTAWEVAILE